jgi:hypothetical protein
VYTQQLYNYATTDNNYLNSIFWGDEFSISFIPSPQHVKIGVYCDLNDAEVHHCVVHNPYQLTGHPHIKVRASIWVNALLGADTIEFMTGTTDLERLVNKDVAGAYMVSHMTSLQPLVQ